MENFVIIDIGSNSVRMAIYCIDPDGSYHEIKRVKNDTRLSEGIGQNNILQITAMNRTISALRSFKSEYSKYKNVVVRAIATAAVRQAQNQKDFLKNVYKQLHIKVRVLTGKEEAYYDYLGISDRLAVKDYLLMDVGGASVEIIHVRNQKCIHCVSVPIGAVKISEQFHLIDHITAANLFEAESYIAEVYSRIPWIKKPLHYPIVLIGGAARAIARINRRYQHLSHVDHIQNFQLTRKQVNVTVETFLNRNLAERQKINGLENDRADVIIGGSLCLTVMMNFIDSKRVIFSNGGVREGLINEYIENNPHFRK
ncbi:Ppx/GppA phosphatase family protein [Fructilactobacillus fructivorans]|uniref:Exopolyphosphatase n=1 Tax=Fructilactobacillus fructivorans TaxID=1614 RepID=A0A0C1M439_9LACO|nr:exopolyphosphatase [Fructilactobacillus fructivorans]KID41064.1 Exopolyphosphatase [Fructilactobacillus fructivorans]MCT0151436.1 exopolyphosphatase [Fructilactobacillus fructivorans]MCT2866955.1 exopolyphosphatase [Fructilactobacillus fructivorans]MCT2869256.1 exopolyphosphatase [Fructilactobacillus fructivorans]MCT2873707.1 exopolyphosphatase [Fructilactobacillus fructivorans]